MSCKYVSHVDSKVRGLMHSEAVGYAAGEAG